MAVAPGVAKGPVSDGGDGLDDFEEVLLFVVIAGGEEQGRFDGLVGCEVPILLVDGVADEGVLSISTKSNTTSLDHMKRSHDNRSYLRWLWR